MPTGVSIDRGSWCPDVALIEFLQQFDDPTTYTMMRFFSFLGDEPFYLLLLPALFWCWHKRKAWPLAIVLGLEFYLNFILKDVFQSPRPVGAALVDVDGFGFPSGHAQNGVVLWGYLAWATGSNFLAAGVAVFLIGLSRLYLGVHFLSDVVGGWALGFLWLFICIYAMRELKSREFAIPMVPAIGLVFLVSAWLVGFYPIEMSAKIGGAVFGFVAGALLERDTIGLDCSGSPVTQGKKILLGALGVVLIKEGLALFFPEMLAFHFVQYGCIGLWIGLGAPWMFVRLRLSPGRT